MASIKDDILNRGFEFGMSMFQKLMSTPAGPLVMRTISQALQLQQTLQTTRESILHSMKIASAQEQDELERKVQSLEKQIERLERRLKEMYKEAKAAKDAAADK